MDSALKPTFIVENMPSLKEEKNEEALLDDEKHLYAMSKSTGWKVLRESIQDALHDLDNINKVAMEGGASLEQIGQNTVVISMAKDIINKSILDRVSDAIEACENADGTSK